MATIDATSGALVVRVVYDGPPLSGKTTSLRALARGLGAEIHTPEERAGRTLYFDWVEYVGGLFEGRQIHCQIVSVPGQAELAERRRALLEVADAVVMVADTRAAHLGEALSLLDSTAAWCRAQVPPVGIVLQANKRDAPDSVEREALAQQTAEIAPVAIVETVATEGDGVRESFVFGVRLALDRVRALAEAGQLRTGRPTHQSAAELLASLQELDAAEQALPSLEARLRSGTHAYPHRVAPPRRPIALPQSDPEGEARAEALVGEEAEEAVQSERASEVPREAPPDPGAAADASDEANAPANELPFVPDPGIAGGLIWPPVDGRTTLHEVARLGLTPRRMTTGDLEAAGGGWRFHSERDRIYPSLEEGRHALVQWARSHSSNVDRLSRDRVVVLADAGHGRFRLWQLLRLHATLRERVAETRDEPRADVVARQLRDAADHLLRARSAFDGAPRLECSLWTVGADVHRSPVYLGLMPGADDASEDEIASPRDLLGAQFRVVVRELALARSDFAEIRGHLDRALQRRRESPALQALVQLAERPGA